MKKAIDKSYGKKGEKVVGMNYAAVDRGAEYEELVVPAEWKDVTARFRPANFDRLAPEWVRSVADVVNSQNGYDIPVSAFTGEYADGTIPAGTAAYEKRGIAVSVPEWDPEKCIQCNQCAYACPHAAIRPFLTTDEELAKAPKGVKSAQGIAAFKAYRFTIQVSPMDCTGCGNCADVCPAKEKALEMKHLGTQMDQQPVFDYMHANVGYKDTVAPKTQNLKNSQFSQPLFEFSGACAGCGETPYIKAITQLFGDRMMVANATRMFIHLQRFLPFIALLHRPQRPWTGMGQLPVRGQCRVRSWYETRYRASAQYRGNTDEKGSGVP